MKDAIKTYFEEAIKNDEALKNAYDEKKLDDCIKYITDQARKYLKGKNGAIADEVVFKWARDFMYGDIEKEAPAEETKEEQTETVQEVQKDVSEESADEENSVTEETVVKEDFTTDIPETLTQEQIEPEETNIDTRCCKNCGYESDSVCIKSGAALGDLLSPACKEYIRRATAEDIKDVPKEKLVIESVEEEKTAEEWKENLQKKQAEKKAKKAKKVDEYDGPTLFDFDDLY